MSKATNDKKDNEIKVKTKVNKELVDEIIKDKQKQIKHQNIITK